MITRKLVKIHKTKKGKLNEKRKLFIDTAEVAETLGISKGHAYKLIRELNEELQSKGYLVVAGKVPKTFWETKFYGYNQTNQTA